MVTAAAPARSRSRHGRIGWVLAVMLVVLTGVWAFSSSGQGDAAGTHSGPAHVEPVSGSDLAHVTVTTEAARRIGLQVVEIGASGPTGLTVPGDAVVYGADGTTWVYVEEPESLTFRRQVVEVDSMTATSAVLSDGPPVGTRVVGIGSAELYGTESGVGH